MNLSVILLCFTVNFDHCDSVHYRMYIWELLNGLSDLRRKNFWLQFHLIVCVFWPVFTTNEIRSYNIGVTKVVIFSDFCVNVLMSECSVILFVLQFISAAFGFVLVFCLDCSNWKNMKQLTKKCSYPVCCFLVVNELLKSF